MLTPEPDDPRSAALAPIQSSATPIRQGSALFFQVMGVSASALTRRYVVITISVSKPKAGTLSSPNQAC
jgi:hypothetical protein